MVFFQGKREWPIAHCMSLLFTLCLIAFVPPGLHCFSPVLVPSSPHSLNLALSFPKVKTQAAFVFRPWLCQNAASITKIFQSAGGTKEGETIEYDEVDLQKMKVADLKNLCKAIGLPVGGKKSDLIERLLEAAGTAAPLEDSAAVPVSDRASAPAEDLKQRDEQSAPAPASQLPSADASVLIDNTATSNDMLVEGRYRLFTQVRPHFRVNAPPRPRRPPSSRPARLTPAPRRHRHAPGGGEMRPAAHPPPPPRARSRARGTAGTGSTSTSRPSPPPASPSPASGPPG